MTPIQGYGQAIPDEMILGFICWYTITQPTYTAVEIEQMAKDAGLDDKVIPNPPRIGDAFKRACRYSESKGNPIVGTENEANLLIRTVTQNEDEIERHVVLEIRDPEDRRLSYEPVAFMTCNRSSGKLAIKRKKKGVDVDPLIDVTIQKVQFEYDKALKVIDAQVIRRMVREQLDLARGIAVRAQGSVYFVPRSSREMVDALDKFFTGLNYGSSFHHLPLIDTSKQRDLIRLAFEDEIHAESVQLITKMQKIRTDGSSVSQKRWLQLQSRYKELKARAEEYGMLVNRQMTKADVELQAMDKHLGGLIMDGLLKT